MGSENWPITYPHYVPASSSFIELMKGATKAVQCAGVKPGENVVISTDTNKMRIAEALAAATVVAGGIPIIVAIVPTGVHGAQLPEPVVAACRESDVFFMPTSYSQTHTDARIQAIKNGSRGATMCDVTEDALCTGAILGDFEECDRLGRKLGALLDNTTEMRIRTERGTDLKGIIKGRPVQYETGIFREPGRFGAFPDSEINISPIEGTAEGTIVADIRIMTVGVTRETPVTIRVKDGLIYAIEGGSQAEDFAAILKNLNDPTAYNIAEFAIGLNPAARMYSTNLEDLGKLGCAHVGIGSNYSIGGKIKAPCHIDAIFKDAVIEFDGKVVMDKGKLMI